ncbi:glycosyltransferase family 4 protein [Halalkalibacter krulwichiae]|uniref:Putative glycosyltransferase EpsD n=1 Tax=Halalkalibacter krulwichiae TaxID=199441 RepID=A0A1X9MG67_9BACI|nr:glycosyltransferase family 4 protein [Halalkalibacter krulwichiae]ARK32455.1 Putative glycosyltransferase EpsD [Halalkalibacter krulwichiae]
MKILYVTTISNTVNAFLIPHIKLLIEQGHQVDVAFNIVQEVNPELTNLGCTVHNIEFQRSPLNRVNYSAYKNLKRLINSEKYDLVHTHTPVASACVRLACRNNRNVKVVYTAHGFHFYSGAPLINWGIYYPIERWLSRNTDVLITINKEDYERAKKSFKAGKIMYIPGVGLDTNKYCSIAVDREKKRKDLEIPEEAFVVLSVGELNKNKNHETVIKAIAKLDNPNIVYVICGRGELDSYLRELSIKLGISNQVKLLGFRNDIKEICQVSDVFAFPSYREGLSVAMMEAMASGLPIVCSDIRGNNDLIEDGKGGYLVKPDDINGFSNAIKKIFKAEDLRYGSINLKEVKKYSYESVIKQIKKIYESYTL